MAAGLGFKTFTTGEVLTAADTNGYLMQGVLVFADAAARDAAITSPQEGQFAYTKDVNGLWYYDSTAWVASGATGDIEGVTAGTGISGGGTSGTVTITNSMATAIDAKGDLVAGTGADAFDRLAVGADGTQLVADSAEATGLKWATPSAGSFSGVHLTKTTSGNQSITNATDTIITFDTEQYDTASYHSTVTNTGRITVPTTGYYAINAMIIMANSSTGYRSMGLFKNGSALSYGATGDTGTTYPNSQSTINEVLYLTASDYLEIKMLQNSGGALNALADGGYGGAYATKFMANYLGA